MSKASLRSLCFLAAATLASACSSPQKTAPGTGGVGTPTSTATPASAPSASTPWEQLTHDQRLARMKTVVLPTMTAAFQGYDGNKYVGFDCTTCHGERIKAGDFSMPNPALPPLQTSEDGFKTLAANKPDAVKFMMGTVKPQMVQILGVTAWEPSNPTGFGCYGCHPMEK